MFFLAQHRKFSVCHPFPLCKRISQHSHPINRSCHSCFPLNMCFLWWKSSFWRDQGRHRDCRHQTPRHPDTPTPRQTDIQTHRNKDIHTHTHTHTHEDTQKTIPDAQSTQRTRTDTTQTPRHLDTDTHTDILTQTPGHQDSRHPDSDTESRLRHREQTQTPRADTPTPRHPDTRHSRRHSAVPVLNRRCSFVFFSIMDFSAFTVVGHSFRWRSHNDKRIRLHYPIWKGFILLLLFFSPNGYLLPIPFCALNALSSFTHAPTGISYSLCARMLFLLLVLIWPCWLSRTAPRAWVRKHNRTSKPREHEWAWFEYQIMNMCEWE
jgi:hypothetical protein